MKSNFRDFGELYSYLKSTTPKDDFLHHKEHGEWRVFSKDDFLRNIRYLTLAFYDNGCSGKQVAIAVSPSAYWMMLDYALMLSAAVSVPLFTNISSKNLLFQFSDSNIHTAFIESEEQEKLIHKVSKREPLKIPFQLSYLNHLQFKKI